ncbi:hypothetical protein [Kribbella sp. NPDC006257]|uniref:hypothetical protein n=1 Tax=Kribbella sp. NPDC006257 TaxID=3156738 RepID=UPI0033BBC939
MTGFAGQHAGVAAHLTSRMPGDATTGIDELSVVAMAEVLAVIHDVDPVEPFRTYQHDLTRSPI